MDRPEIVAHHVLRDFMAEHKSLHQRAMVVKSRIDACEFHLLLPLANAVEVVGCAGYRAINGYLQIWAPKISLEYAANAPVRQACAAGYSGWEGVVASGDQLGSATVSGLLSMSPLRIAVTGRQKLK